MDRTGKSRCKSRAQCRARAARDSRVRRRCGWSRAEHRPPLPEVECCLGQDELGRSRGASLVLVNAVADGTEHGFETMDDFGMTEHEITLRTQELGVARKQRP